MKLKDVSHLSIEDRGNLLDAGLLWYSSSGRENGAIPLFPNDSWVLLEPTTYSRWWYVVVEEDDESTQCDHSAEHDHGTQ